MRFFFHLFFPRLFISTKHWLVIGNIFFDKKYFRPNAFPNCPHFETCKKINWDYISSNQILSEEFILENIDDDEDTNEPQKTVIIDERSLGSFVEGPVTMVSDVIGENDCYLSGGGYRKSREKRKREKEENFLN